MDRQYRKVLDYMRTYKTITTLSSTPRKVRDRDGAFTSVSAYYLEGKDGEV